MNNPIQLTILTNRHRIDLQLISRNNIIIVLFEIILTVHADSKSIFKAEDVVLGFTDHLVEFYAVLDCGELVDVSFVEVTFFDPLV